MSYSRNPRDVAMILFYVALVAWFGALSQGTAEAASSSPYVSTEFSMDVPRSTILYTGTSTSPAIARNAQEYMMTWEVREHYHIFAARMTPGGGSSGEESIFLGEGSRPAIAASENWFLVAWQDPERIRFGRIHAALVKPDGDARPLPDLALHGMDAAVASNGRDFLVIWVDMSAGSAIHGRRVTVNGVISPVVDLTLNEPRSIKEQPRVASNGTDYLAVWHDGLNFQTNHWDIFGATVNTEGSVLHGGSFSIASEPGPQLNPAVASDGRGYFVVWEDQGIVGRTVTGSGNHLPGPLMRVANGNFPEVTFDGAAYLALWLAPEGENVASIKGLRLDTTGGLLDMAPQRFAEITNYFAHYPLRLTVAGGSNELSILWSHPLEGGIRGLVRDMNGVREPALPIALAHNDEEWPAIASNGRHFLVVWRDTRNFQTRGWEIFGTVVDTNGRALNPHGINITATAAGASPLLPQGQTDFRPRVASDGRGFLVAWQQFASELRAVNLSEFGQPSGNAPLLVITNAVESAVASNGTNYLVSWIKPGPPPPDFSSGEIWGAFVSPINGILEPGEFLITDRAGTQSALQAASNGTNYLLVWENSSGLLSTIVDADGSISSRLGVTIGPTGGQVFPSVTAFGTGYYVVWASGEIYARRVSAQGLPIGGGSRVTTSAEWKVTPAAAASSETEMFLVWAISSFPEDLRGAHITGGGTGISGFLLGDSPPRGKLARPAIAQIGSRFLTVYEGPGLPGTRRIFGRFLDPWRTSMVVPPAIALPEAPPPIGTHGFDVFLMGEPKAAYQIDISTNLIDWSPWEVATTSEVALRIRDRTAASTPQRFYRAQKVR